ncbi:MAG: hydroxymethylglutaryl-CoA lyase [Elusimicrobia bacterium]|nr:hydroxymethylglutaryl-CoA lyase [Elusimicrobiota bacterium]
MSRPAPRLVEVGPRDGLQSLPGVVPLEAKVAFVDALSLSGLSEIEAGAFVSPKAVPQMADSEKVFAQITRKPGVIYSALVPNEKGLERALAAKIGKAAVFTAASEPFNQTHIHATIAESIERVRPVVAKVKTVGLPLRAYISTAFWCPFDGQIAPKKVVEVARRLQGLGINELSIGDTIGKASPDEVRRLLDELLKSVPVEQIFLHFHDTYGKAVANALAAWSEFGVYGFDASTGGVGGCPYAPGASGNVAMEDLVSAFESAGGRTGVDAAKLKAAAALLVPHAGPRLGKISA